MSTQSPRNPSRNRLVAWIIAGGAVLIVAIVVIVFAVNSTAPAPGPTAPASARPPTPTPSITDSTCEVPSAAHAVVPDNRIGDLDTEPIWVDTGLRIAPPPGSWLYGVTVDDGLVLVRSEQAAGVEPTGLWLVELPAGRVVWQKVIPETAEGFYLSIFGPRQTGVDALILQITGAESTSLVSLALDDGAELSRVGLGTAAGLMATSLRSASYNSTFALSAVVERELVIVQGAEETFAASPSSLDEPVWSVPGGGGVLATYGDVVFIDGAAHDFDTGSPLGWTGDIPYEDSGGLVQLGDLLFDMGDGTTLTQIDPATGSACGTTEPMHFVTSAPGGYFVVDGDLNIRRFDARGDGGAASLGKMSPDSYGLVVADRLGEGAENGDVTVHANTGGERTVIGPLAGDTFAHDSQRLVTFNFQLGLLTAYDLDSGEQVWATSEGRAGIQLWGGYVVSVLITAEEGFAVTVLQTQ